MISLLRQSGADALNERDGGASTILVIGISFVLCGVFGEASAQSVLYEGAVRYSQGKYTLDDTVTSAFLLNEFTYSSRFWFAEALLPVIYQDSTDVQYVGGMPMPVGDHHGDGGDGGHHGGHGGGSGGMPVGFTLQAQDFSDLGVGDPYLKVGALVYRGVFDRNLLGVFGTVKAPVADETRGFGTGEWDVGLGVSWSRRTPESLVFLELTYWSLGEPPEVSFKTPVAGEVTYGRALSNPRYSLEVTIWGRTKTVTGIDGLLATDLTLGRSLNGSHSVYFTVEAGLTESAPDFALIVGFRARIWDKKQATE